MSKPVPQLGIVPTTREFNGSESTVLAYVVSANLHRRQMNESQRAMVARKIALTRAESAVVREARKRGEAPSPGRDGKVTEAPDRNRSGGKVSSRDAAALFNVSAVSVSSAGVVQQRGIPELIEAVEWGQAS